MRRLRLWLGLVLVAGIPAPVLARFVYFDPTDLYAIPSRLSETGIFDDIQAKLMDTAAKYYEVNAPLWSDGAIKRRWIILQPGHHIPYNDSTDFFDYPDSTVFVKTFLQEKVEGDSTTEIYWETRLWVKKIDDSYLHKDWYGFSFKWNADQTEAFLASPAYHGFDTTFATTTANGRQTYKKWHFPSQDHCWYCHAKGPVLDSSSGILKQGRSILGFYPAQLKRPSPVNPGINQVLDLFSRGVFTGTLPNSDQLAARFKGIGERMDPGLTPAQRFAVLDTMARSYIAANCSNCHSTRGKMESLCKADLNFDFYNLKPKMEFGMRPVSDVGLTDTTPYDSMTQPNGRFKFILAVTQGGMDTAIGQVWNMTLPPQNPATLPSALVYPGYPALSELLFRAWSRYTPADDSGNVSRAYRQHLSPTDDSTSLDSSAAANRLGWIFSRPWGSQSWLDTLGRHGLTLDSLIAAGLDGYNYDPYQMPTLLSFTPDTAALRLLGEWVKNYRPLAPIDSQPIEGNLRGNRNGNGTTNAGPVFRGHTLCVPMAWTGKATLFNLHGRAQTLPPMGPGSFLLPSGISSGVYLFQVGSHRFTVFLP